MNFMTLAALGRLSDGAYFPDPKAHWPSANWQLLTSADLGVKLPPSGPLTISGNYFKSADDVFAFVAYNATNQQIALVFRGTDPSDLKNWKLDVIKIPTGLLKSELELFSPLISAVKAFANSHNALLLSAGHSLGGAIAEVLYDTDAQFSGGAGFGSPSQPANSLALAMGRTGFVTVEREQDLVPKLVPLPRAGPVLAINDDDKPPDPQLAGDTFAEHSHDLYAAEIERLAAAEPDTPVVTGHILFAGDDGFESRSTIFYDAVVGGNFGNSISTALALGPEVLVGGSAADTLRGGSAADLLWGGRGNDSLQGGNGKDSLVGGDANDTLDAGGGADTLDGGAGNDRLIGSSGSDRLMGGSGADTLSGGNENDRLVGGGDNDSLNGGSGSDSLFGGVGADTLDGGGGGGDALAGGAGGDRYLVHPGDGPVRVDDFGGDGVDVLALYTGEANALSPNWFSVLGNDLLIQGGGIDVRLVGMGLASDLIEKLEVWGGTGLKVTSTLDLASLWGALHTRSVFRDDFNRPDGSVGAGWSDMSGTGGHRLALVGGRLEAPEPGAAGGIYRGLSLAGPVAVTATVTDLSGYGGVSDRFDMHFMFGSSGDVSRGYELDLVRGDANYQDSRVILVDNGVELGSVASSFQFDQSVTVSFTLNPAGSITGQLSDGAHQSSFSFGPHAFDRSHQTFGIYFGGPDSRSGSFIFPTLDNLRITHAGEPTFNETASAPSYMAGGRAADVLVGSSGADTIEGGGGPDHLSGAAGDDHFVFHPGELGATKTAAAIIFDFHLGVSATHEHDHLDLSGFGSGSSFTFAGNASTTDAHAQYYRLDDPTDASHSGYVRVTVADSTNHLSSADFTLFGFGALLD